MTSEYRYRGRDIKDVKERAEQQGGSFDRYTDAAIPMLRVGKSHTLRILPPPYDIDINRWGKNWGIPIYVHYNVGPDKGTYLCLNKMEQGDCPVCEARAEQKLQEGEQDPLKPTLRYLCYVIDRDNEREGPMLWALPWTIEREIQSLSLDGKEGLLEIDHPDEGYDVSFTREGKGIATKWVGVKIARKSSPIHDNLKTQKAWLAFIEDNPLPETLHFETYKYLDKVYRAKAPQKSEDDDRRRSRDDDDERPARRGHAEERGGDDAEEGRRHHSSERAGRHSADAEAEDIPDKVHRSTRRDADADEDDRPSRSARDTQTRRAARADDPEEDDTSTRSRGRGDEREKEAPEAKTRADIARERVNALKAGADKDGKANGKRARDDDPEDNEREDRKAAPERSGGRPQRRRRDDDDEIPY